MQNTKNLEISTTKKIFENMDTGSLYEEIIKRNEGNILNTGALAVNTGYHTARAAKDKFIIKEKTSEKNISWGEYNVPLDEEKFQILFEDIKKYLSDKDLFIRKCRIGSHNSYKMNFKVITEKAWHSLFVKNLFIDTNEKFEKEDFTIIAVPDFKANPKKHGTRSETAILINFKERIALIANSGYAGEIKKTAFTIMNYMLPLKNVFPMHCSANVGKNGDSAIFFGLSGTGKTTLSSDPKRNLIGDDEHGWCEDGIFNFEGGCYAKVINLSKEAEPQIYKAVNRFSTVLENVIFDEKREPDFKDGSKTENTRAAYPLNFIENAVKDNSFPHPKNIIFLTYDAFGILPPVAKLEMEQAMYHFISGYTAKVANTEIGIKEPKATFSACFGGPFMVWAPEVYAKMLKERMEKYKVNCWLINTGLTGGPYGIGKRISIKDTREIVNYALTGDKTKIKYIKDEIFGFYIPQKFGETNTEILNPENAWKDKKDYMTKKLELAKMFLDNYKKLSIKDAEIDKGAPKI